MDTLEKPLLSLCIPTYNRAAELQQMLENLVSLDVFKNSTEIEAIVSDNASTDNTEQVARSFVERFPTRISYYRNAENVIDRNFGIALSKGKGIFLKLSNDTLLHTEAGLRHTLDAIRRHADEKPMLCFRSLPERAPDRRFTSLDDFWQVRSFHSTWIAEFGTWQSDFTSAEDYNRNADTHLTQVDFLLRQMSAKTNAVIIQDLFFTQVKRTRIGQGGVNAALIFGQYYFDLLFPYVKSGEITNSTWQQEKWNIFRYLVLNNFLITSPLYRFPKDHYVKHLFKYYKWKWYFWVSIPFVLVARVVAPIRYWLDR